MNILSKMVDRCYVSPTSRESIGSMKQSVKVRVWVRFGLLICVQNMFQRRIGTCEKCAPLFSQEKTDGDESVTTDDGFKTSIKVVDSDKRLRELELELAQTKLSLVEAECRAQDLEHKLSAAMTALQAEENKPWFKKIGSKTSGAKDMK